LFPKLRAEAVSWDKARTNYMMARLTKGNHPDTDAKFWAEWKPAAPPSLEVDWFDAAKQSAAERKQLYARQEMIIRTGFVAILAVICWGFWRFAKRHLYA